MFESQANEDKTGLSVAPVFPLLPFTPTDIKEQKSEPSPTDLSQLKGELGDMAANASYINISVNVPFNLGIFAE